MEFGVNRGVNVGSECGLSVLDTSTVEEVALPVMVLDEEESLVVCDPLLTVIPPEMALSMDVHNDSEVLDIGGTLDVSKWVKNRIPKI